MSMIMLHDIERPFKNEHLSVSRLKLYDRCPLAFKARYIDRCEELSGDAAMMGKLAHRALELIFGLVIKEEHVGRVLDGTINSLFRQAFREEETTSRAHFFEALLMVRRYMACLRVDHRKVLSVEREIDLKLGGHRIKGFIDRIDRRGERWVEIIDYKTNRQMFTREELDQDLQMSMYGIAVRKLYPWAEQVTYRFDMLRHGESQSTSRTIDQLRDASRYVIEMGNRIESSLSFPAKLHHLCGWCSFRGICGAYQEAISRGETMMSLAMAKNDPTWIAAEMDRAAALVTIARRRKEELSAFLLEHLDRSEDGELMINGSRYRTSQKVDRKYPRKDTLAIMSTFLDRTPEDLDNDQRLSSLTRGAIAELAKEAGLGRAQQQMMMFKLSMLAKHNPGKPYVTSRRIDQRRGS